MKALHLFAGIGGGALGFQRAGFETVGAVDFDASACRDFELLVGRPCTHGDLSTMSPAELASACTERPDVVFTSPPCKGFSGCLPSKSAALDHYQAMNALTLRGIWLALEAWPKSPALSPVSAGLPVADGDAAATSSAAAEFCCTRGGTA